MFHVESLLIKTDVTFVKILGDIILAGIGGHLQIFDRATRNLRKTATIFEGQKIYGIAFNLQSTECLVYGANKIKIFCCTSACETLKEVVYRTCDDWILTAKWLNEDKCIATVFMHNSISLWTKDMCLLKNVACLEKCILYSAFLINDIWENLVVLSGTVFSEVLIWKPKDVSSVIHRLQGHKGVIFSIDYNPTVGLICSTSDDRSAKLWSVSHKDIITELALPNPDIYLKCNLFGHTSRVFRCQILDEYIITAGEDSFINIWNLDGSLVKKIDGHPGAPVWVLDYDKETSVITSGGGDCGLSIFCLKQNAVKHELRVPGMTVSKQIAILNNNNLAIITEKGVLFHYWGAQSVWKEIAYHAGLKSYALLEVSSCRNLLVLAGYRGLIIIYKQIANSLKLICSHEIEDKTRIFSIHWLSSERFLTCGSEGNLMLFEIREFEVVCINKFILPISNERWTTAAVALNKKYIAVGDRRGNVYLYSVLKVDPIQVIRKAHNHLGVTNLHFKHNILTSLGRNSIIKKYLFNEQTLISFSSDKVSSTWLAAIHQTENNELLLSFMGNEFIMWDYKRRRILLQFDCGGGHRSWDFLIHNGSFHFVYIKDKIINMVQVQLTSILPLNIIEGYHVNEINTAIFLKFNDSNKGLLISGGEDTTLRINKVEIKTGSIDFVGINVLKSHLSSIRVIKALKISEDLSIQKHLLFTGGGRDQIIVWELETVSNGDEVNVYCRESSSYYEQDLSASENRIMDVCTIVNASSIVLISACSNGTLKVFLVVKQDGCYKLSLIRSIFYKLKCILKVSHIVICNRNILLSMATDGKISFWDITVFLDNVIMFGTCTEEVDIKPFDCIETHQSGINSFSYMQITDISFLLLTGGDDNAIVVSLVNFSIHDDGIKVHLLNRYCEVSSHCAQITGAFIANNYFLTTSIDQKLNIFNWQIKNNTIVCSFLRKYDSSISDIQGMHCCESSGSVYVYLFGKGLEICEIKKLC